MAPFSFAGRDFCILDRTALYWPAHKALILADLHLEKASWFAQRGQMLPPHDSLATLERIARLAGEADVEAIWTLGDNFHDSAGVDRMTGAAVDLLARLTRDHDWVWITGNHDEHLPPSVGGRVMQEMAIDGLILRHQAEPGEGRPELSGHFHPKVSVATRGRRVTRACFVASPSKLILPAFGALTGGLTADHPEIVAAVGAQAQAIVQSGQRALRFAI